MSTWNCKNYIKLIVRKLGKTGAGEVVEPIIANCILVSRRL